MKTLLMVLISLCALSGCSLLATHFGASTVLVQVANTVDTVRVTVDTVVFVESGKTTTDHLLGKILEKDCSSMNILNGTDFCQ